MVRQHALAAFQPLAPCTPPPGCADAPARYRFSIGSSGRPRPGPGGTPVAGATATFRRRLRRRPGSGSRRPSRRDPGRTGRWPRRRSRGVRIQHLFHPGHRVGYRSRHGIGAAVSHRVPARQVVYAHRLSDPSLDRDGSVVVICPTSMNGRSDSSPRSICSLQRTAPSVSAPMWRTPERPAGSARHCGVGEESS